MSLTREQRTQQEGRVREEPNLHLTLMTDEDTQWMLVRVSPSQKNQSEGDSKQPNKQRKPGLFCPNVKSDPKYNDPNQRGADHQAMLFKK